MTKNEYLTLCLGLAIDPALPLENNEICAAIKSGDKKHLIELLNNLF
jgi:hypothetical protein